MDRVVLVLTAVAAGVALGAPAWCDAMEVEKRAQGGGVSARGADVVKLPEGLRVVDDGPGGAPAWSTEPGSEPIVIVLGKPLGNKGTVSFWVRPRQWYRSGPGVEKFRCDVLKINRVGKFWFQHQSNDVLIAWDWDWDLVENAGWIGVYVPEMPGPEWYHVLYTWDAENGLHDAYLNGVPQQQGGVPKPWTMAEGDELQIHADVFDVAEVKVSYQYLPVDAVSQMVPEDYQGRRSEILGFKKDVKPIEVEGRMGELLHESSLSSQESMRGWVLEGPGVVEYRDGWMELSSQLVDGKPKGHLVYWCPEDFPGSFVAEWDFQQTANAGLTIVFFAAKGENGEDIFDPKFPKRDGTFKQYTSEGIVSYHISYFASARATSNLRKNNKFYLIANGPPGIQHLDTEAHRIRLIKDGAHIQMLVDDRVIIDYVDDGKHYGKVYGEGKIGLRQMQDTVARYRNFRVWELKQDGS